MQNDTRMEYYIQRQEEKAAFHSSCQHKMPNQDTASLPEQTADNQNGEPIKCKVFASFSIHIECVNVLYFVRMEHNLNVKTLHVFQFI